MSHVQFDVSPCREQALKYRASPVKLRKFGSFDVYCLIDEHLKPVFFYDVKQEQVELAQIISPAKERIRPENEVEQTLTNQNERNRHTVS
jgi:hypothetical protein